MELTPGESGEWEGVMHMKQSNPWMWHFHSSLGLEKESQKPRRAS